MSIFRRAEVSLMSYLYRNRTVRLAKKRSEMFRRLAIASTLMVVWYQCEYKVDRLIKANEELAKPESFMIDGPDPFKMSRH